MWTRRAVRPTDADRHRPQLPLVYVVDPPTRLGQVRQRIIFGSSLDGRRRPLLRLLLSPRANGPDVSFSFLHGKGGAGWGLRYLPQDALALPTVLSTGRRRSAAASPRPTSGPTLAIPLRIAVPPRAPRRHQSLVPDRRLPSCGSCVRDDQQQSEYNMPRAWCASHRPPPVRDRPIRTPGRLFCKCRLYRNLRYARHERLTKRCYCDKI